MLQVISHQIGKTATGTNICEMNAVGYLGLQSTKGAFRDRDIFENSLYRDISPYVGRVNIISWKEWKHSTNERKQSYSKSGFRIHLPCDIRQSTYNTISSRRAIFPRFVMKMS